MSNVKIKIEDLLEKIGIEDQNLIIVEDEEDTKKSTVKELKKSLSGDYSDPDSYKFYSSIKVKDLINQVLVNMSSKASQKELNDLYDRVNQMITNNPSGTKDQELIDARGRQATLSKRFDKEREISESTYLEKFKKDVTGVDIDLNGHVGYVDIQINKMDLDRLGKIKVYSKNLLDLEAIIYDSGLKKLLSDNGFIYTQSSTTKKTDILIPLKDQKAGVFYFLSNITFSGSFKDKNIKMLINYKDGTSEEVDYDHSEKFMFTAKKSIISIMLKYNVSQIANGQSITFGNVMVTPKKEVTKYIKYYYTEYNVISDTSLFADIYNNDYLYTCAVDKSTITVYYYDHKTTAKSIVENLENINMELKNTIDHCGLIEDYGTYQFFGNCQIMSYPESMTIKDGEDKYKRNGMLSKKITINNDASINPMIKQIIDRAIPNMNSVSLCFYIDKTTFYNFTDKDGIRIHLSSDNPSVNITNYYTYTIKKNEMVQGWNFIKKQLFEFTTVGNPDSHYIQSISIEIGRNDNLNGLGFYLNCAVFNQKMKPTILLSFDGTFDSSINYLYPFLRSRKIPATIFLNNSKTLSAQAIDYLIGLRCVDGWDIGQYGCNPNKEQLTDDDNYRNQYMALKSSKQWLVDNLINNPTSYSAPYGNLRPMTVPLLKDLGYTISRTSGTGYVSNFTENDFAIPMQLISNEVTFDVIKQRIDYAINNGVALSLYTRDVTEYGSESDSTQVMFESIINYIIEKKNDGQIECLTMKDFYTKCVNK